MNERREKFTPGPWVIDAGGDGEIEVWAPDTGYVTIAICSGTEPSEIEKANARLITAAPDLFEALQDMLRDFGPDYKGPTIDAARAAIARARGADE